MATSSNKKKIILVILGTAAAGVLGYFGWQLLKKEKHPPIVDLPADNQTPPPQDNDFRPAQPQPRGNDNFPLKRGSRGPRVKAMQQALIAKYGKSILPKYGADGSFGKETLAALRKQNLPETIDESTYSSMTQTTATSSPDTLARSLHAAASTGNLKLALLALRQMKTKDDYAAVSDLFKQDRTGVVHKTLVTGLLDSFSDEGQKQQIRLEFSRMGLNYDGNHWTLAGLSGFTIITRSPATIWKDKQNFMQVPAGTVLGTEAGQQGAYTAFENNGQQFLVLTSLIKYL